MASEKTFLINTNEEGGMGGGTVVGSKALVAWLKKQRHNPGEPEDIGVWAKTANIGDTCNWACGNVVCVTGETYTTAEVRGVPPARMDAWVQEWEERCQWGSPCPNWFMVYATQDGSAKHIRYMRLSETKAGYGEHNVPEDYDLPTGYVYKTVLQDGDLIKEMKKSKTGVRVNKKPVEVRE